MKIDEVNYRKNDVTIFTIFQRHQPGGNDSHLLRRASEGRAADEDEENRFHLVKVLTWTGETEINTFIIVRTFIIMKHLIDFYWKLTR